MGATNYTTNSDMLTLLALRVKEYRLAARMSQKELAERSGVGLTTICHLEQGANRNITLNNFISLLRAVGMEQRLRELLPELPMPPMALKQINKFIPKRVRRNSDGTES
jgi:transcriptional regulator with XRE-family HTH domain